MRNQLKPYRKDSKWHGEYIGQSLPTKFLWITARGLHWQWGWLARLSKRNTDFLQIDLFYVRFHNLPCIFLQALSQSLNYTVLVKFLVNIL